MIFLLRTSPRSTFFALAGLAFCLSAAHAQGPGGMPPPPPPPPGGMGGGPGMGRGPGGMPFDKIAKDLGVSPEKFRAAFHKLHPTPPTGPPTPAQRQADHKALAAALHVSPARLEQVMKKYRPARRPGDGSPPPGGPQGRGGFPGPPAPR